MARQNNPLRNEAEEFIRSEIARLGPDNLDKGAIARRFVEAGASKTRVHAWIAALVSDAKNPPADTSVADMAVAEAAVAAAETAKVLDSLPTQVEIQQVAEAVAIAAKETGEPINVDPPPRGASVDERPTTALTSATTAGVLLQVQALIEAVNRVMTHSHHPDGRVRNPRMILQTTEAQRRVLELALKLYEAVNSVRTVERFLEEMVDVLRTADPSVAGEVISRMQARKGRWKS